MAIKAEIGAMHLQAKGCQALPVTTRSWERCGTDSPSKGTDPLTPQLGPLQPEAPLSPAHSPPIDHLVTLLQPADARHPPPGGGTIQVHDHVILRHQEFQTADDIPGHGAQRTGDPVRGCPELGSPRSYD